MGIVEFLSKRTNFRRGHLRQQPQVSSSESSQADDCDKYDHSSSSVSSNELKELRKARNKLAKKRQGRRRSHHHGSNKYYDSLELLTREELIELPAKKLRKRCRHAGIDTSRVVEKSDLVELLYEYYQRQTYAQNQQYGAIGNSGHAHHSHGVSNGRRVSAYADVRYDGGGAQNMIGLVNGTSSTAIPNNNNHHYALSTNDENEQMIEILQEIIPYFNQGDVNIDEIVKDTIERLPFDFMEKKDANGNTLLLLCCQSGANSLIPLLLSKGSDPNALNNFGESCLHFTSYTDTYSPESAQILVQHGAKAEIQERRFGCTSLHYAASVGDIVLCRILIEGGAHPMTRDNNGYSPIDYATQSKKQECMDLLQRAASTSKWNVGGGESKFDYVAPNATPAARTATNPAGSDYEDWEELIDDETGFPYFHNRNTGKSLWEDEFRFYQDSKATKMSSTPMAFVELKREQSFRRAPASSTGAKKSTRSLGRDNGGEVKAFIAPTKDDGKAFDFAEEKLGDDFESKDFHNEFQGITVVKSAGVTKQVAEMDYTGNDLQDILSDCSVSTHSDDDNFSMDDNHLSRDKGHKSSARVTTPAALQIDNLKKEKTTLSPTVNSKKLVSKESFDQRLECMQEQFARQLQMIEDRKSKNTDSNEEEVQKTAPEQAMEKNKSPEEESEGNESCEGRKEKNSEPAPLKSTVPVRDVMLGDSDVRDEVWVASVDFNVQQEKIRVKEKELSELQNQCIDLKASLGTKERMLLSMEEKQSRSMEQISVMEDLLQKEKDAKNEAVVLLEQARSGIASDAEVAHSLEQEKKRSDELVERLTNDVKQLEKKIANEKEESAQQIEESQKKVLQQSLQLSTLSSELEGCRSSYSEEKKILIEKYESQIEVLRANLTTTKIDLEREINHQRGVVAKAEEERNKSIDVCREAERKAKEAEMQLDTMSEMVEQARAMLAANEKLHKTLHLEIDKRKALHNKLEDLKGRIRVYVRIRPLSKSESAKSSSENLVKEDKRTVVMYSDSEKGKRAPKSWEFDQIFSGASDHSTQEDVFKDTKALITSAIDGFNVCIFCYGQTGSGKTYTMFGPSGEVPKFENPSSIPENIGLAPRAVIELFDAIEQRKTSFDVSVHANMFELYNDNIRDLIALSNGDEGQNLRIKLAEHSKSGLVEVDGAIHQEVKDAFELLDLFRKGAQSRSTASTKMNADSSRSHLITSMVTKLVNKRTGHITNGKITLVDLAGSERVSKSGATGAQLKEAQSINKSLSALGDVINALTSGSKHIPYRNHPLTMLMSDSMGGNAKTLMFVCASPADYNSAESTNALDFAKRCKNVTNNVKGGRKSVDTAQVKMLKAELARMKKERGNGSLVQKKAGGPRRPGYGHK